MAYANREDALAYKRAWNRRRRESDPEWRERQNARNREYQARVRGPRKRAVHGEALRERAVKAMIVDQRAADVDTKRLRRAHVALVDAFVKRHPSPYNVAHWADERAKIMAGDALLLGTLELRYALAAAGYRADAEAIEPDTGDKTTWVVPSDGGPFAVLGVLTADERASRVERAPSAPHARSNGAERIERDARILQLVGRGMSYQAVAEAVGVSKPLVGVIVKREREKAAESALKAL